MKTDHLKAAIIEVTRDGHIVTAQAFGDSMDGVPATTVMHFRNGAVAFQPGAFDAQGNYANSSQQIFQAIGAYLAPNDAPPSPVKR